MQGINKIEVIKSKEKNVSKEIRVYLQGTEEPVIIGINKNNQIVKYKNERGFSNAGKRKAQTGFCKRLYKRKN